MCSLTIFIEFTGMQGVCRLF